MKYCEMSAEELKALLAELNKEYEVMKAKGLSLDMSRGKPSAAQLSISNDIFNVINENCYTSESGIDCRNYGNLEGIPEARKLMGDLLGVNADNVLVCGNASLNIMYDCVARAMLFGIMGCTPWCKLPTVKFLCPVPGYDRHFKITETFGIEMINIPMTADGPDMDMVEKLVASDSSIKGMWCVPKYSNPQGIVYSDETVRRLASMTCAAKDFRLYWDNAYAVHHIYGDVELLEILSECEKAGNPDRVLEFCSTSKITFAGGGISALAASSANIDWIKKSLNAQTISYDKLNQLRHVVYFKNADGIKAHMGKHAEFLRPKFDAVLEMFEKELGETGVATWLKPMGGYFVSVDTMEGCAKAVVAKCKEAGVVLTGAGATFPYGKDPKDSNIRIAPSYPTPEELSEAAKLFTLCVKIVSIEKLLSE